MIWHGNWKARPLPDVRDVCRERLPDEFLFRPSGGDLWQMHPPRRKRRRLPDQIQSIRAALAEIAVDCRQTSTEFRIAATGKIRDADP